MVSPIVLDAAQAEVVGHAGGPLLVLAGPGTGKTTTLVEAVARRVEAGADPASLLVLTFSRRAARHLRERLAVRLGAGAVGPAAWTFHAWCLALLRVYGADTASGGPRLLSGPEQDARLRDLLEGSRELGRPAWPDALAGALGTRGFAEEVRMLMARAREVGVDPPALARIARRVGRADWKAVAEFYGDYLDALGAEGAIDYADLVHSAANLTAQQPVLASLRQRYQAVFVDEYQDTDPAQERLLAAVAGGGGDLVVFGDPDQAIYAFRGAQVRGLLDFPARFPSRDGSPAPVTALRRCRRMAPAPLAASRRVAARLPSAGLPVRYVRAHRDLVPADSAAGPGQVSVRTYPTAGAEAEAVADLLRREHLENGVGWADMAVLVRSTAGLGVLRRVLTASGVPVSVGGGELPVAREPAAELLLTALRCADDPSRHLTPETARALLTSPLGGADPAGLRALGRELRALDAATTVSPAQDDALARDAAADDAPAQEDVPSPDGGDEHAGAARMPGTPASSSELLRAAVADPQRMLLMVPDELAAPVHRLGQLLRTVRAELRRGGAPEDALWTLWSASGWGPRLERASAAGGAAGRSADRDLDAVVALFDAVERLGERRGPGFGVASVVSELTHQQIAPDTETRAGRPATVRLLTAHRSKGLEWQVVVVCGVQDGVWPDLRQRHSLLGAEQLDAPHRGGGGVRPPRTRDELLADERRLFYVALTRARRRLVVTAVDGADDDGEQPSRFLDELGVQVEKVRSRSVRPLTLVGLVAALRRLTVDPDASAAMRSAAAVRLAALAAARDGAGRTLVPAAHPNRWWGLVDVTSSSVPVVAPDGPIALSGSSLSGLATCGLRWFLEHEAQAAEPASAAQGFGKVVHALADEVSSGRTPARMDALDARLDLVWRQLEFDSRWRSEQERSAAREALRRFLDWHAARRREVVASEVRFACDIEVAGRVVRLRGFIDRVELDDDGRVHVVDFKTGRAAPSRRDLQTHAQLGSYQLAVREGALDRVLDEAAAGSRAAPDPGSATDSGSATGLGSGSDPGSVPDPGSAAGSRPPAVPGGAELVHLRRDAGGESLGPRLPDEQPAPPEVQAQEALPTDGRVWIDDLVEDAVRTITSESFRPTPGDACTMCSFRRSCPARPEGEQVID
ncbi:ATP-dependent DNA helicase [Parafrankia sp. EUN1f]|uniref:ATP-dependent helicase n=1 Tax=Parafrankia sp. EUN1f TaxID=102897 RepID=UPI0001C45F7F|nr:ATP-dependent DNA helicase [Parafrankia sp. EUN1f]EFC81514.1 UvrD/REP helicase [Parafrankia sp. EUN1f]